MTCIRDLQERAGRIGRAFTRVYDEQGQSRYAQELRATEQRLHDEISRLAKVGPCPCDRCRAEERRSA